MNKPLVLLLVPACFLGGACTYTGAIRENFYNPNAEINPKIPARVALFDEWGERSLMDTYRGASGSSDCASVFEIGANRYLDIKIHPALVNAVKDELSTLFENVAVSASSAPAAGEDVAAVIKACGAEDPAQGGLPAALDLSFRDPESGALIAQYHQPVLPKVVEVSGAMNGFLACGPIPPFVQILITCPVSWRNEGKRAIRATETALRNALREAGAEMRRDHKLADYFQRKRRATASEQRGDAVLASGDHTGAVDVYAEALAEGVYGSAIDARVRVKYLRTLAMTKRQPRPPSPEAKLHMLRGQQFVKQAAGPEEIQSAIKEFTAAVVDSPWLSSGYFNLGLAQGQAGDYDAAITNLKLYLTAVPEVEDAEAVRQKIVALGVSREIGKGRKKPASAPGDH